ncbi:MAG: hypothetical protein LBB83_03335 [Treponema sp.]|nr:hypothetical protein [Treponema sp.]
MSASNSAGEESAKSSYISATTLTTHRGGTSETAIVLSSSIYLYENGELSAASPEIWYTFSVPDNSVTYYLLGRDKYNNDRSYTDATAYTANVKFEIYDSGLNLIKTVNAGNGGYYYTPPNGIIDINYIEETGAAGEWYVKVVPNSGTAADYGTYAIYFYHTY